MGEAKRYSGVAMLLHWLIAIAVIVNWRLAEAAEHTDVRADAEAYMGNHAAIGITILALTLARLAWRALREWGRERPGLVRRAPESRGLWGPRA